uniref:Uncharacterized protein n=1 Tax=Spongospora subterranea TaxID=70186 RepID=A0A0H5QUW7_9EUKA|eukprot:CRZ05346.1 hypothetical protein [Spongospora subterranea]
MSGVALFESSPPPPPTSIAGILANEVEGNGSPVKVQSYEFRRDLETNTWDYIKVGSLDWHEITSQHSNALVVRVSSIVNENEPDEVMERLHAQDFAADAPQPALHVVCMFKEFAVSESSPVRFTANFLFIFPSLGNALPSQFKAAIRSVLCDRSISYITAEMLGSFLARRDYEAHAITKVEAQEKLAKFIQNREPCSSFFLKMSPVVPEFCRLLLIDMSEGDARELIGVRAIHKLAISCTSSSMASQHNFQETMAVMKMGVHPNHWNFVVFKTLMRLATKNDKIYRKNNERSDCRRDTEPSQVQEMLDLIQDSHLDPLEKLAVRIISSAESCTGERASSIKKASEVQDDDQEALVDFMVSTITSEKDYLSNEDFKRLLNMIEDGRPAACHLTGVLLEKCIEEENFNIGWRVASTVESVNEHTIEEVVTLCSKAFFKYSRNQQQEANKWFNRVKWCFERHHKLLGKYPSGLALHVAAHRRDFDLCWRWFQAKKEDRAFRFSAHHTSSILKAASYAADPALHMKEVLQAYDMTPCIQKSAFVFEPLVHLWNATSSRRDEYRAFWAGVEVDLRAYLDRELKDPDPQDRKMRKLAHWDRVLSSWSCEGSDAAAANFYPFPTHESTPTSLSRNRRVNSTWPASMPRWANQNCAVASNDVYAQVKTVAENDENLYNRSSPIYQHHLPYPGYPSLWRSAEHVDNGVSGGPSVWLDSSSSGATLTLDASAATFRPGGNAATAWSSNQGVIKFRQSHLHDEPLVDWSSASGVVGRASPSLGAVSSSVASVPPMHDYRPAFTRSFAEHDHSSISIKSKRQPRFNDQTLGDSSESCPTDALEPLSADTSVSGIWPARGPLPSTASWPHAVGLPL